MNLPSCSILCLAIIYLILIGGCNSRQEQTYYPETRFLTSDSGAYDYWPCFSPDGKTVLFSRSYDSKKTWSFFSVSIDSGESIKFSKSQSPVSETRPNWSWPHNKIAFTGMTSDTTFGVWLINGDGSIPQQFAQEGLSNLVFYPSWYPDTSTLAVVDGGEGEGGVIKKINILNNFVISLTDRRKIFAGMPRVSPDGAKIAFAGQLNKGQLYDQTKNNIWILEQTGTYYQLDSNQGRAPSWSPDGKWVGYQSNRGNADGLYAIFIASVDGSMIKQITAYELNARHPSWSPDGGRIVFSAIFSDTQNDRGIAVVTIPSLLK